MEKWKMKDGTMRAVKMGFNWCIFAASATALFWLLWRLIVGSVPAVSEIQISDSFCWNYFLPASRWWDVEGLAIYAILFSRVFAKGAGDYFGFDATPFFKCLTHFLCFCFVLSLSICAYFFRQIGWGKLLSLASTITVLYFLPTCMLMYTFRRKEDNPERKKFVYYLLGAMLSVSLIPGVFYGFVIPLFGIVICAAFSVTCIALGLIAWTVLTTFGSLFFAGLGWVREFSLEEFFYP